jgi:hypothetical protein
MAYIKLYFFKRLRIVVALCPNSPIFRMRGILAECFENSSRFELDVNPHLGTIPHRQNKILSGQRPVVITG